MHHPLSCQVFFIWGSGHQLGCTVAAVSAQQPVEHVKNVLLNITTEGMKHSVYVSQVVPLELRRPPGPATSSCWVWRHWRPWSPPPPPLPPPLLLWTRHPFKVVKNKEQTKVIPATTAAGFIFPKAGLPDVRIHTWLQAGRRQQQVADFGWVAKQFFEVGGGAEFFERKERDGKTDVNMWQHKGVRPLSFLAACIGRLMH